MKTLNIEKEGFSSAYITVRWTNYNISKKENDVNDHPPSSLTSILPSLELQFHFIHLPAFPGPEFQAAVSTLLSIRGE
jgi:hypothetical protein